MARKKTTSSTGGSATMKLKGFKPVVITLAPAEHAALRISAAMAGVPMAHLAKAATIFATENHENKALKIILEKMLK